MRTLELSNIKPELLPRPGHLRVRNSYGGFLCDLRLSHVEYCANDYSQRNCDTNYFGHYLIHATRHVCAKRRILVSRRDFVQVSCQTDSQSSALFVGLLDESFAHQFVDD